MDRSTRRQRLAAAVRRAVGAQAGTRTRPSRQEWAASRKREGWDDRLVDVAISGGALSSVRAMMLDPPAGVPGHVWRAIWALSVIDTQRLLERRSAHGLPVHRARSLSPRIHEK